VAFSGRSGNRPDVHYNGEFDRQPIAEPNDTSNVPDLTAVKAETGDEDPGLRSRSPDRRAERDLSRKRYTPRRRVRRMLGHRPPASGPGAVVPSLGDWRFFRKIRGDRSAPKGALPAWFVEFPGPRRRSARFGRSRSARRRLLLLAPCVYGDSAFGHVQRVSERVFEGAEGCSTNFCPS